MTIMSEWEANELRKQMEIKEQTKITGKITKLSDKGWGFIISEEMKFIKFFFHWTGLLQDTVNFTKLQTGMKVKFIPINLDEKPVEGEKIKGPRAIKIEVL